MIADVSHWHPVIDWTKAKQNSAFLIAKATQGTKYVDPTLKAFIKGCEANEIPYWVFVYLAKGNELAQAKYMVSVCSPVVGKYFMGYCLDIEEGNAAANVKSAVITSSPGCKPSPIIAICKASVPLAQGITCFTSK